jgi:hypothetical protein
MITVGISALFGVGVKGELKHPGTITELNVTTIRLAFTGLDLDPGQLLRVCFDLGGEPIEVTGRVLDLNVPDGVRVGLDQHSLTLHEWYVIRRFISNNGG